MVVAPSGAGKTTLVDELLKREKNIRLSISYTTREPRKGEKDGREYHFIARAKFEKMIAAGEFLEHADVYGNYYGTSRKWIDNELAGDHDVLLEIDWQGARQVRALFPHMVGIFILPPSIEELERRMRARAQDSDAAIRRRVANAREELEHAGEFKYVIINKDFESARRELAEIIERERAKP